jgi:hypothetical protein
LVQQLGVAARELDAVVAGLAGPRGDDAEALGELLDLGGRGDAGVAAAERAQPQRQAAGGQRRGEARGGEAGCQPSIAKMPPWPSWMTILPPASWTARVSLLRLSMRSRSPIADMPGEVRPSGSTMVLPWMTRPSPAATLGTKCCA